MADDFTLLDRIAPYLPCVGCLRRQRIYLLPSPPASTSQLPTSTSGFDREPDLLSLHSDFGRDRQGRHTSSSTSSSAGKLSRWQLLQSWWSSSSARSPNTWQSPSARPALHVNDESERDAQELLMPPAASPKPRSPRKERQTRANRPQSQRSLSRYSDYTTSSEEASSAGSGRRKRRSKRSLREVRREEDYFETATMDGEIETGSQSTAPTSVPDTWQEQQQQQDKLEDGSTGP